MKPDDETIAKTLDAVNRRFYQAHHSAFNTTRQFGWPGWQKVMNIISAPPQHILDIGCGNGRFARFLDSTNNPVGPPKTYLGLDPNTELLRYASESSLGFSSRLLPWTYPPASSLDVLTLDNSKFDLVVAFGILHHIYGKQRRAEFVRWCNRQVAPGGHLVISAWDFGRHPRFLDKVVSADVVLKETGLHLSDLEPNDHFLGFGVDTLPLRYCHWIDDREALELISMMEGRPAPSPIVHRLEDSSDLNRYWIWEHC